MPGIRLLGALLGLVGVLSQPASGQQQEKAVKVTAAEYEGWRQYSVHCARCHGQDVLPNPVAANLLLSLGPGGAVSSPDRFTAVVVAGRLERGMPAFKGVLAPERINAIYAYVAGRAVKRIPPGRPAAPAS
jgi:mono/diheme cytochrome c family protein